MPRIDFQHPEIIKWYDENNGEGTSIFDLCIYCLPANQDGKKTAEELGLTNAGFNGDPIPPDAKASSFNGDHPDIDEVEYTCDSCGRKLTSRNYYWNWKEYLLNQLNTENV